MKKSFWRQAKEIFNGFEPGHNFYSIDIIKLIQEKAGSILALNNRTRLFTIITRYLISLEKRKLVEVIRENKIYNLYTKVDNDGSSRKVAPEILVNKHQHSKMPNFDVPVNLSNKGPAQLPTDLSALQLGEAVITFIAKLTKILVERDDKIKMLSLEIKELVEVKTHLENQIRDCKQRILELNNSNMDKSSKRINLHALQELVGKK